MRTSTKMEVQNRCKQAVKNRIIPDYEMTKARYERHGHESKAT